MEGEEEETGIERDEGGIDKEDDQKLLRKRKTRVLDVKRKEDDYCDNGQSCEWTSVDCIDDRGFDEDDYNG